jgi:glycerophosphoryl diester phosphodiesterase
MTNTTGVPLIGAHRGATASAAENTMAAFAAAINLRADFIETDIRRTADNVLVLHHDPGIGGLKISATPFADLPATPATLEDLLQLAKGKIGLDLELKEAGYEPEVAVILRAQRLDPESFVITSFLESAVRRFKESYREAKCGLLIEDRCWSTDLFPEIRLRRCGAGFVAAENSLVTPGFVRRLTSKNFPVWVWTVNDPIRIAELLATPGVEAIITDTLHVAQNAQKQARGN